ncbi:osmosensitive K+ channel histidine kinase [Clostridium sp. SY8519]|nr:osmosensitive K+ channel histidine kinase [Clostridium sp. SY8519]
MRREMRGRRELSVTEVEGVRVKQRVPAKQVHVADHSVFQGVPGGNWAFAGKGVSAGKNDGKVRRKTIRGLFQKLAQGHHKKNLLSCKFNIC